MQNELPDPATEIHIGAMLKHHIDSKRVFKSSLARRLQVDDSMIIQYQKKASLQTGKLLNISHALKHNFFADIAALLPAGYSTNAPVDDSKDKRMAELEEEIKLLKAREAVLLEVKR